MGGKSDHTIVVNDEILLLKESNPKGQIYSPGRGGSPPLNLKPLFLWSEARWDPRTSWNTTTGSWMVCLHPAPHTYRHWRWERLLFAVWSRCGWTKWREDVQLEKPINQLPRPVCLDKYHLLLNSQRKISPVLGTCHFSAYYAEAFVSFRHPKSHECLRAMVIFVALNSILDNDRWFWSFRLKHFLGAKSTYVRE